MNAEGWRLRRAQEQLLAERLIALGSGYDASPGFPADTLDALREAGLHRRFAPSQAGGETFSDGDAAAASLAKALRFVGRCDLSLGRLFEGHVNAMQLFGWYADDAQMRWLSNALDSGAWFGVWATEPAPGVQIDGNSLRGSKSFASGAGGLDYALVTAAGPDTAGYLAIVPANDPRRADISGWRVRGMRATMSGLYDLSGLALSPSMLVGQPGDYYREPRFTGGAWRFCAVQLGGIEALLVEMRAAMGPARAADPIHRARFAKAIAATRTAGFWVAEAARRVAAEEPDAASVALMTRGVVEDAAFGVMECGQRMLGTRSAFDGERADKIIRDLSLYLRQGGPDQARDSAALAFLDHDCWSTEDKLW